MKKTGISSFSFGLVVVLGLLANCPSTAAAPALMQPLAFEANHGQTDPQVKLLSRGRGYTLFVTPTETVFVLTKKVALEPRNPASRLAPQDSTPPIVVRMKLVGANPAPEVRGLEGVRAKVHYFSGNEPKKWRTEIPVYAKAE